ncbi:MAG: 3-deoxy-D-manno-octulosonate 8-phosphate phosphatase [Flavobacteriales bacterium]|nr:3-deoxy-D-manno-octulosonate 8-phosphate phosphatase [Flavobacteriales bacterium]|tara:strand:- start:946 stop:1467 length:522 start_codon:yes stop_codon:yes gene_type:complete
MNYKVKLKKIKAFVFDCDGVLTDGSITLLPGGEQVRKMSTRDGYAMQLAVKKSYIVALITGGNSSSVKDRMNKLGIHDVYMACADKVMALQELIDLYGLDPDHILYMGDDLPDFDVLKKVGLPTCPDDAVQEIKNISEYISYKKGGQGCARDVIEQTLKIQGHWHKESSIKSI